RELNLNFNEITDLRPLQNLKNLSDFQASENFLDLGDAVYANGMFTIPVTPVYDVNGTVILPTEVVLSARNQQISLPLEQVYQNGVISIDEQLLGNKTLETIEVTYASEVNDFSVYTFHMLKRPTSTQANPVVAPLEDTIPQSNE
ncbi:MAG: hypothetical protein ACRCZG_03995, partial [Culicoidibacterales bacterium]